MEGSGGEDASDLGGCVALMVMFGVKFLAFGVPFSMFWLSGALTGHEGDEVPVGRLLLAVVLIAFGIWIFIIQLRAVGEGGGRRNVLGSIAGLAAVLAGASVVENSPTSLGDSIGVGLMTAGMFEVLHTTANALSFLLFDTPTPRRIARDLRKLMDESSNGAAEG